MSLTESVEVEIAYKCDLCVEIFNSPADAQNHNEKVHPESELKDDSDRGLLTLTPAEDREEEAKRCLTCGTDHPHPLESCPKCSTPLYESKIKK